jgi:hypothetical protein
MLIEEDQEAQLDPNLADASHAVAPWSSKPLHGARMY